jgi:phosphatidylglycerophosphate synthase
MSVTVSKDSISNLKSKVQANANDKSNVGIIVTVVVSFLLVVLALFIGILKWVLFGVAVILMLTVGYRVYKRWKSANTKK